MTLRLHSVGRRAIQNLAVKCENVDMKCGWVGTVGTLEEHVAKCKFGLVPCKFKGLGCDAQLKKNDLAAHEENDKLHLHMAIETIARLNEEKAKVILKTGELFTFKMNNYERRKKSGDTFRSSSFYTSCNGYNSLIAVFFLDKQIGIGFKVLEGDVDNKLRWPFVGEVKVTLLNQLENANHYGDVLSVSAKEQVVANNNKCAVPTLRFTPYSSLGYDQLNNIQYLKDNTLYFTVSVEVADHKPWLECTTDKK